MKKMVWVVSILLVLAMVAGCSAISSSVKAASPEKGIVGTWKSDQDGSVVEYTAEGKYKGLNESDYAYEIIDGKQIKITNPEYADGSDAIILDFTLEGDILKTVYNDYEVTWKRVTK